MGLIILQVVKLPTNHLPTYGIRERLATETYKYHSANNFFHPPFSVFFKYVHNTTWMILTLLISVYMSQNIHHREYYQWQDQCKKSARKTEMKAPYCTTVHHPAFGALVSLAGSSRMILPEADGC